MDLFVVGHVIGKTGVPMKKKKLVSMELNCTNIIIDKRSNLIMTQKYKFR